MIMIKNIALLITAIILFIVVFVINLLVEAFLVFSKSKNNIKGFIYGLLFGMGYFLNTLYQLINQLLYMCSLSLDRSAGVMYARVWNYLFISKKAPNALYFNYNKGEEIPSISKRLGQNYKLGTLSKLGLWFKEFLDLFEKDHIIKAD